MSICNYLMVIYTPRLCNDVAFLPARDGEAHGITCKEVLNREQIEEYRRKEQLEVQRLLSQELARNSEAAGDDFFPDKVGKKGAEAQEMEEPGDQGMFFVEL